MKDNILGERIKTRREEIGMTQTQLAEATGYADKSAISKIEKGINDLTQSKIVIFANALRTTSSYLMGWVDDPNLTKEQVATVEQARRLQAYSNYLTFAVSKHRDGGSPLPEEIVVAYAYRNAPKHIQDAIKTLLEIKEE